MHFAIEKSILEKALRNVVVSAQRKSIMPALGCVKIVAGDGKITMTTTNLETETCDVVDCSVITKDGVAIVPVYTILDIVSTMPADVKINFESKDESCSVIVVSSGKRINEIVCLSDEFPDVLGGQYDSEIKLNAKAFGVIVKKVSFAMSQAPERHNLNGIHVSTEEEDGKSYLSCVATDGHRLCFAKVELSESISLSSKLLPRKAVSEMIKLLDVDSECSLCFSQNKAKIKIGNMYFATKLVDASFPDYKKVVPQNNTKTLEIKMDALANELKAVSIVAQGKGVKLTIKPSSLFLECIGPDGSKSSTELDCTFVGEDGDFTTTYNPIFLEDVFKVVDKNKNKDEIIRISFKSSDSPSIIQSPADKNAYYVVMPMKAE
ncbi:MAG: DNA polymerase III subunit beta [Alphaproteobacteria bacterium]|nr:DNA polymerase III subunit beta [Rickettsiales bacterium]